MYILDKIGHGPVPCMVGDMCLVVIIIDRCRCDGDDLNRCCPNPRLVSFLQLERSSTSGCGWLLWLDCTCLTCDWTSLLPAIFLTLTTCDRETISSSSPRRMKQRLKF